MCDEALMRHDCCPSAAASLDQILELAVCLYISQVCGLGSLQGRQPFPARDVPGTSHAITSFRASQSFSVANAQRVWGDAGPWITIDMLVTESGDMATLETDTAGQKSERQNAAKAQRAGNTLSHYYELLRDSRCFRIIWIGEVSTQLDDVKALLGICLS